MTSKVGGRIVRVKLKGFMTYDELEIFPVKGLNLILGLNGSGKSSIMCAICLGLGGKPQFTGRFAQLSECIKDDHSEAIVEIELESTRGRNDVIKRVINMDKPSWYLNKKVVNQSEITALVKKYNIDMGNLCQFLPQEKVAEFSKMDKKQRLLNMIQAIGDPSLLTLFVELKELRNNCVRLGKDLEELENNKVIEEKSYERLKSEIESHEDRKNLEFDLKLFKFQKMSCEYAIKRHKVSEKATEINRKSKEISLIETKYNQLEAEKTKHSLEFNGYETKVEELKGEIYQCLQILINCYKSLQAYHEEVDSAKIYFENRMKEKTEQMDKLAYISKQNEDLKDILKQKENNMADLKEKLSQNTSEYEKVKQQFSLYESDIGKLKTNKKALEAKKKHKEKEVESYGDDKKVEVLFDNYPDTYLALKWLKQNKSSFKSRISFPPLVSIKIRNGEYTNEESSKFIENTIAVRDLLMFICDDKEDLERFVNVMKNEKKLFVNVSMAPAEKLADFPSQPITSHMRDLGIHCYLKDLFTAPDPVMRYLCKLYRIHQVPVCSETAEENIDSILKYSGIFLTASEKISGLKSHYGQQGMSVRRDDLVSKNVFPNMKDNPTIRELQEIEKSLEECKSQLDTLVTQRTQLEVQQKQLKAEKNNINKEEREMDKIKTNLALLTDMYEKKVNDIINEEDERKKMTDTICSFNNKKLDVLAEILIIVKKIMPLKMEKAVTMVHMKSFVEKISTLENKISPFIAELDNKKSDLSKLQQDKRCLKTEALKLYQVVNKAEEEGKLMKKDGATISALATQPHKLEEIEQQIACIEAKLELANEDIAPIIAEYKKRECSVRDIENQVKSIKANIEDLKIKIEEKKEIFLEPLLTHIESVNKKFSEYYKILRCAGEISLDQTGDTDDFPNYGLQIKLKYRVNEEFMELSPTHYSGGECSVAAIIFILSLQELTDVPFRCIDEINQGMDTINERTIYKFVADAAGSESCCQYFLFTPKLLMDLSYHKAVAVHIIFNSPYLRGNLNVKEHLKIKKK